MADFFLPPKFNLATAWFADAMAPTVLKTLANIEPMEISAQDKAMLRSLKDKRLLYFSNHPTQAEPVLAWQIANIIGARFNYMATRRAFDTWFGSLGKLFQATGAYSIIPGIADRESMRMTRKLLSAPNGKLVLFPEGEPMCGENDNLMPFQSGIVKLSFAALEDARKKEPGADITILPGFVKYVIQGSESAIRADLESSITRLEDRLGLAAGERNLLRRFLMVGRVLLEQEEKNYGITVDAEHQEDFDFRIGRLRHVILDSIADRMGIKGFNKDADAIMKLRHISAVIEMLEIDYPSPHLPKISSSLRHEMFRESVKAYDFIVIKRDYLISHPTPERFYEWLARFESLALGKTPRALGGEPTNLPRKPYLSFAKPFGLAEYYDAYKKDKAGTVKVMMDRLLADMTELLETAQKLTRTIVTPYELGGK